jgi:hypothetical protein
MGSVGSQVVTAARVAVAAVVGIAVVVGCSASGDSDPVGDVAPTDPGAMMPPSAALPASGGPVDTGDSSTPPPKDAGTKDSAVDAGPPPPVPGTPCSTLNEMKKKKCGACGQQATLCLGAASGADAGDAGGGTWSDYGPCENELVGGCIPGTTITQACGNCGTQTKTCSQYCGFSTTACAGQPAMSCVPGAVDLSNAGCSTTGTFHQRSCSSTCTYGNFGSTCDAAPTTIEVGPVVGNVTSTIATLTSTQTATRLGGSCPTATLSASTTVTPYVYVKIHNPLAKSVVVSVYDSVAPGGVVFPTLLASYGATTPSLDTERKACVKGVNDFGDDALTGDVDFASLSDTDAVTIPAGGVVTIYNGAYNKYSAANPSLSTGNVKVNVRLEKIN